jgi:hypothetical protein
LPELYFVGGARGGRSIAEPSCADLGTLQESSANKGALNKQLKRPTSIFTIKPAC